MPGLRHGDALGFFVYVHHVPSLPAETDPESQTGVPSNPSPGPTLAYPPGVGCHGVSRLASDSSCSVDGSLAPPPARLTQAGMSSIGSQRQPPSRDTTRPRCGN